MTTEYAIAYLDLDGNITVWDDGYESLEEAQTRRCHLMDFIRPRTKIMRRTVGPWEEA